jgi:uncharacterized membrane protein
MNLSPVTAAWICFGLSMLMIAIHEGWLLRRGRLQPGRTARSAHARLRIAWVAALKTEPGFEVVAVQTLRNSLMSATITASTAALALMGSIGLTGSALSPEALSASALRQGPRHVIELLLMLTLFASYVSSAMAMRYYNHAGFVMSMPYRSEAREHYDSMAVDYVHRAGLHYSWGLRFFIFVAPLVAGVVNPLSMPVVTLALLIVLHYFDRPALPGGLPGA